MSVVIFVSCDDIQQRGIDTGAVREEMAEREVRKLSQGEIMEGAMKQGNAVANACAIDLQKQLALAIEKGGLAAAAEICAKLKLPAIDSISEVTGTAITRPRELPTYEEKQPDGLEEEILSAYRYNVEHELDLRSNVQMTDNNLLFTRPIMLDESLCMRCHGTETSIEAKALMSKYDQARPAFGYKHGDLLGMWSILLQRSQVVKNL